MIEGKKIIYVDASSLKHSGCTRHLYRKIVTGYRPKQERVNLKLGYGKAIHKGLEIYYSSGQEKDSLQAAISVFRAYEQLIPDSLYEFRTPVHLVKTLQAYFRANPFGLDGIKPLLDSNSKPMLEQSFAIPFFEDEKVIIMIVGTIDINGEYHEQRALLDHKTSSMTVSLKDKYFHAYKLDIQMMMYVWADNRLNKRGDMYLPIVVNALFLKKPTIAAQKAGLFDGAEFHRSGLIEFSKDQMLDFERWMSQKIQKLIPLIEEQAEDDFDYAACHEPFSLCSFFDVCSLPKNNHQEALDGLFSKDQYNPLTWYD